MRKKISQLNWIDQDPVLLKANSDWILPQVLALFANTIIPVRQTSEVEESLELGNDRAAGSTEDSSAPAFGFTETLRSLNRRLERGIITWNSSDPLSESISLDTYHGILSWATCPRRGDIIPTKPTQSVLGGNRYAGNIPLVLSALKEFNGTQYSSWDYSDEMAAIFVDEPMLEVFRCPPQTYTKTELLEFLEETRLIASGAKYGQLRNIPSITAITGVKDVGFRALPRLVKLMLVQAWCYHPSYRHPLAVSSLVDFDRQQPSLLDQEIFIKPETVAKSEKSKAELWQLAKQTR